MTPHAHTDLTCDNLSLENDPPSYSIIRGSYSRTHENLWAESYIYFRGLNFGSAARGSPVLCAAVPWSFNVFAAWSQCVRRIIISGFLQNIIICSSMSSSFIMHKLSLSFSSSSPSSSPTVSDSEYFGECLQSISVETSLESRYRVKRMRDSRNRCSSHIVSKKDAPWQRMLDMNDKGGNSIHDEKSNDGKYFRRRFRMPYILFKVLIREMLRDEWFTGFGPNGEGRMGAINLETNRGASLQVMVLSVLRILGRGTAFDECYDGSGCREESIRVFFHKFCPKFVEKLMGSIVRPPVTKQEISEQVDIYQRLGMGGAVGSTDCTHFALGKCSDKISVLCTGKEGFPTLAYSMTSSHSRKILHCSAGFFGSRNDKTISKHDSFIEEIRTNDIYTKFEWTMNVDEHTTREVKGVFLLCDGGYHKWAQMICPLKHTSKLGHTLWSCQLESVRKDIECTFGILKVRFRVLQHPLPYMAKDWNTYRSKIDNIVWSCCILHNMLLKHDGLEFLWTNADYLSVWYVYSCVVENLHAHNCAGTVTLMQSAEKTTMDLQSSNAL
jgi:hypothetical protein